MRDSDYRLFAVDFVRRVESLLVHPESRHAFDLAGALANGEAKSEVVLHTARDKARKACERCAHEARDGRSHAAEAACLLLSPSAKESIQEVMDNASKALAAKIVVERRGGLTPGTQNEFEYVRAVELELLRDRLTKLEAGK